MASRRPGWAWAELVRSPLRDQGAASRAGAHATSTLVQAGPQSRRAAPVYAGVALCGRYAGYVGRLCGRADRPYDYVEDLFRQGKPG
jgi:hypothetical protein